MNKVYGVYYTYYAEGVEKEVAVAVYSTREAAEKHCIMEPHERDRAGILEVVIKEVEFMG